MRIVASFQGHTGAYRIRKIPNLSRSLRVGIKKSFFVAWIEEQVHRLRRNSSIVREKVLALFQGVDRRLRGQFRGETPCSLSGSGS
jgi:hypothetical protein